MVNLQPVFHEADFRKSSYSDPNMSCVHVVRRGPLVVVRDSKTAFDTPDDGRLMLTAEQFDTFLAQHRR